MATGRTELRALLSLVLLASSPAASAVENIDPAADGSRFAFAENVGWLNAEPLGNGGPGVEVGNSDLRGYSWSENVGWISLSCLNTASCATVNYGVANNGSGTLSGFAWGENVGWINMAPVGGGVVIDPVTGIFSGVAWGENI